VTSGAANAAETVAETVGATVSGDALAERVHSARIVAGLMRGALDRDDAAGARALALAVVALLGDDGGER
jgi:hypothetical protein